ncbi:helix-turn-helix domain-containing protein [Nocardioides sp. Bht2]|uniref:helix-turn-helix domain-containing protein n=1 Tax=Nocardioides sp. Bht2 TaxID=3392297 RepID=UPI0039B37053
MTAHACSSATSGDAVERITSDHLGAVAEVTAAVRNEASTDEVLELIAAKVAHATGHTMALVMAMESGSIRVAASYGVSDQYVDGFAQRLMTTTGDFVEAPTTQAYRSRRPIVASTSWLALGDESERRADQEGIRSLLSMPLAGLESARYVINVYCPSPRCFTEPKILEAESLANVVALLLDMQLAQSSRRLAQVNQDSLITALQTRCTALRIAQGNLDSAQRLVAAGAGLPELLTELSDLSGANFEVTNSFGQLLARAVGETEEQTPTPLRREVLLEDRLVATLHIDCAPERASRTEVAALLQTAPSLVALVLQREWAGLDAESRLQGNLVEELLTCPVANQDRLLTHARDRWGIDLTRPMRLILARVEHDGSPGTAVPSRRPLLRAAEQLARRTDSALLAAEHDDHLVVLCTDGPEEAARQFADNLRRELGAHARGATVSAAVADASSTIAGHRDAYQQSLSLLQVLAASGQPERTIGAKDLGLARLLLGVKDPSELIAFATETLGPIQEYDQRRNGGLVETLRTYFQHACNAQETGRRLHLHANSVGYRLKRISELLGIENLGDPQVLLRLELALAIERLSTPTAPVPSLASASALG